jgi:AcrR family transcriptional regulator
MRSSASVEPTPALRGRPRSQRARRAILDAARTLVEKGGYAAATIEAVAARSGVAKTTVYRWWPNRAALVVDLLVRIAMEAAPLPPTGGDPMLVLRTELYLVAEAAEALPGRLLISLLGEAEHDPDIRGALQVGLFTPRRLAVAKVIRRAQLGGALRRGVPPLLAADLFYGPLFYRKFIRHEPVSREFVRHVFQNVLAGMQAPPRSRSTSRSK